MIVDEIQIHNDSDKPVRTMFNVTQGRVQHYDDIIDYMTKEAISRFVKKHKKNPSIEQVQFLKKELTRYAVIRHDISTAQKLEINKIDILLE